MAEIGDRYRWGQHARGGFWQGTDRLKNRKLEVLPTRLRFHPSGSFFCNLMRLATLISEDPIAAMIWEGL